MTELNRIGFWYLRHGQTDWNAENLSQGNVDIPLNRVGLAQAGSAALLLRDRGIKSIVTSPLSRARATADVVGRELGLPVAVEAGLREVAFGVQEGKPMAGWFDPWIEGALTPAGAESFASLTRRAVAAVNRCLARLPVVLIVGHGAFFRALRSAMGQTPMMRASNAAPMWCEPPAGTAPTAWINAGRLDTGSATPGSGTAGPAAGPAWTISDAE